MSPTPLKHEGVYADFDGSAYIAFNPVRQFNPKATTIAFWLRHRQASRGDRGWDPDSESPRTMADQAVVFSIDRTEDGNHPRGEDSMRLWLYNLTNLQLQVGNGTLSTGIDVSDGHWHHVAFSLANSSRHYQVTAYLNGFEAKSKRMSAENQLSATPALLIGGPYMDSVGNGSTFVGSIAQFRVFEGVRSEKDLRAELFTELTSAKGVALDMPLYQDGGVSDSTGRNRPSHQEVRWQPSEWIDWDGGNGEKRKNLHDYTFTNAYLRGARLANYDLEGQSFAGADLTGMRFEKCTLTKIDVARTTRDTDRGDRTAFRDCSKLPADLYQTTVDDKTYLDWRNLDLRGSRFAKLPKNLSDLYATRAELSGFDFRDKKLKRAVFREAMLISARMARIDAHSANFDKAQLNGANLTGAKLIGASFKAAWLDKDNQNTSATLAGAIMERADFTGAHLFNADLSNVILDSGILANAELLGVKLSGSYLYNADFGGSVLTGASFSRACLINAVFRGAEIGHKQNSITTSFDSAVLLGADFTAAFLRGVNLRNALLSDQEGSFSVTNPVRGRAITLEVSHKATILPVTLTELNVICPNGDRNQCSVNTWRIRKPLTAWKYDQ